MKIFLHFLSCVLLALTVLAVFGSMLFMDPVAHPYRIQAIIVIGGIVLAAMTLAVLLTKRPASSR